uniref:Uncharacterized protein n=1 Tax=Arundo donax TaxID=35708 RepID=A0A0A9H2R1_ARUDO
MIPSLAAVVV